MLNYTSYFPPNVTQQWPANTMFTTTAVYQIIQQVISDMDLFFPMLWLNNVFFTGHWEPDILRFSR